MPTLDVTDGQGKLRDDFSVRVIAVMLYPGADNATLREEFVARCTAECRARGVAVPLDGITLRLALDADHHPLAPKGNPKPWRAGTLAGEQLAWLFSLVHGGVAGASMGKARYLVECGLSAEGMPGGEKHLADAWRSHGSVAHFWAAYILRNGTFHRFAYLGDDTPPFSGTVDFIRFLWEAEQIRHFATNYRPNKKARLFEGRVKMMTFPTDMPSIPWHPGWPPLGVAYFVVTPKIERWLNGYHDGPPSKRVGRPQRVV